MERRAIAVEGIVQGVGFRPFVYALAQRLRLAGFIKNRAGDVWIEVEGETPALDHFVTELLAQAPPLARIEKCTCTPLPRIGEPAFSIKPSDAAGAQRFIPADVATCPACLDELCDPTNRRYHYPFINCTNCGPRLTIITGAPYDRPRTTMAGFVMCAQCRAEYDDPANRRFHAQPTCCRACGPRLRLTDRDGRELAGDPLTAFARAIVSGKIGALKGLGGFHLVCAARSDMAVAELRRRKTREEKPFALMVADLAAAEAFCEVAPAERELLCSRRRPIVLLQRRPGCPSPISAAVAPGNPTLGVMLPYTPLHYLLLRAVGGIPLVMTSGNCADEPIAYDDADALARLGGIADLFLLHDRPIHVRCDDSVTRIVHGAEMPLRRSRGYAPEPIPLPFDCREPIAALGGQLKGTFALGRGRHAFLSHHLGDLDHFDAYRAFVRDLSLYEQLFDIKPRLLVHDLHPDYATTRYAQARGEADGMPLLAVQHHHAHMASCMAENGLVGPAIGVSLDGTGFGPDGAIWGGEFLVGDYGGYRRVAHLRYVGMPGAEQAIREPWRMALAHLVDAGMSDALLPGVAAVQKRTVRQMLERRFNTPPTSSAGRLFDAVAALVLGQQRVSFEAQAAMRLEWLACGGPADTTYPWQLSGDADAGFEIDTRPLIRAIAEAAGRGHEAVLIARRFHATVAEMIAAVCARIRAASGIEAVVLSGGVFMNALLLGETVERLRGMGFAPCRHRLVPTNDGGLCLGQLAIAAASLGRHSPA